MKISILSLFRDSERIIYDTLTRLESLEENTDADFEYFFYENDSTDKTVEILSSWIQNKEGKVISQELNAPKFGSVDSHVRVQLMAHYRNTLLDSAKPLNSDFTIVFDSDVIFEKDIINQYLPYFADDVAMLTPNITQNIKCKMCDCGRDSYYDSWALMDKSGNFCMTWSHNPFYNQQDRDNWDAGVPVQVYTAFGGFALIKSEYLNQVNWAVNKGTCEHWGLCHELNKYGKVLVIPNIQTSVYLPQSVIGNIKPESIDNLINFQKDKMNG